MLKYLVAFLASVAGAFTQRVSGFGFAIVAMMAIARLPFGTYGEAPALAGLTSMPMSAAVALAHRKKIDFRLVLLPILSSTAIKFVCIPIVAHITNVSVIKRILGGFFIVLGLYFLFFSKKIKVKPSVPVGLVCGLLSGVLDSFFSMGGPPVVLYFSAACGNDKDKYLASTQCFFAVSGIITIILRIINGMVTLTVMKYYVFTVAGMIIGLLLGKAVYKKLRPEVLKRIIYGFMIVSGLLSLING